MSMDDDEVVQPATKRRRLCEAEAASTPAVRQLNPGEQRHIGGEYNNVTTDGYSRNHFGDVYNLHPFDRGRGRSKDDILLESLTFSRMDARLNNVTRALPKTCDWLFSHTKFKVWLQDTQINDHHGFLWIKGKPGSGKSTIMKNVWTWAKKKLSGNIILSYFFNARAPDDLEKSSLGLYRSLVHQILCKIPQSKPLFFARFALKERDGIVDEWPAVELQEFLIDIVKTIDTHPLSIFIDALDEGEEDDVRKMIDFLQELGQHSGSSNTRPRVCLSSRHFPYISIRKGLSLIVEHQAEHQQDIEKYVKENLIGLDSLEIKKLKEDVCLKADGIFLWVVLVVRMLNKLYDRGCGIPAMTKLLKEVPKDLEGLFADILNRISEDRESCVSLLQWVLYSTRPMSSDELYLAVQFSQNFTTQVNNVPKDKDQLSRFLLNCSRGLTEETKSQPPVVQFIHETVRDFLTGEKGLKQLQSTFTGEVKGSSHDKLKYGCYRYIQNCSAPKRDNENKTKNTMLEVKAHIELLGYAVSSLFLHVDSAENNGVSQRIFLKQMQNNDGGDFRRWVQWRNALERFKIREYPAEVPLLYIAAEYNLISSVKALVAGSVDVNAVGGRHGTALQAACFAGHEEIVLFLLQNGANVNEWGGEHKHPLLAAIYAKKYGIVELLRRYSACPVSEMLTKPLFDMIARDYSYGIQILMEYGPDLEAKNSRGETPLYLAVSKENTDMVGLFLQKGANVNTQGGYYGNTLQAASVSGQEKVVQMLLDLGANPNTLGGQHRNALQAAIVNGHEKVVKMLLDHGADVNSHGGTLVPALYVASANGDEKVVQMLLDHGAVVNPDEGKCGTALYAASVNGREKVVQMLLDHGADVNSHGGTLGTALYVASAKGREKVVQMLLDHGADVNSHRGTLGTALYVASAKGHEKVVQILLDHGADVNSHKGTLGTALYAASHSGREKVVQMLLDHGADVNSHGGTHSTPLHAARYYNHEKVVQILLERGATFSI